MERHKDFRRAANDRIEILKKARASGGICRHDFDSNATACVMYALVNEGLLSPGAFKHSCALSNRNHEFFIITRKGEQMLDGIIVPVSIARPGNMPITRASIMERTVTVKVCSNCGCILEECGSPKLERKTDKQWTNAEVETLKQMFSNECSDKQMADALNRIEFAVQRKRCKLGLLFWKHKPKPASLPV